MHKWTGILLAAALGVSMPAMAQDTGGYAGVKLGPVFVDSEKFKAGNDLYKAGAEPGFNLAGQLGYDFGLFRLEGELGFQNADGDDFTLLNDPALGAVLGLNNGDEALLQGRRSALSGMVNGYIDLPTKSVWEAFVGGGLGIARVKNKSLRVGTTELIDESEGSFAWQGMAGIRRAISDAIDLSLEYRYFQAANSSFPDNGLARTVRGGFASHSLLAGFTFKFGREAPRPTVVPAAAPAPQPEPVPAPAPAPEPVVEAPPPVPGPFLVFFDWDSSTITPEAEAIISDAAEAYRDYGAVQIRVEGHADRSGPASYNDGLSVRRALAVQDELAKYNIGGNAITTQGFGEGKPLIETLDGVREPQNRRVEIIFPER